MLYYTIVLCCILLYYTVLYCTVLCHAVLYCIVLLVLNYPVLYCVVLCHTVLCYVVLYCCVVLYCIILYCVVLYCTVLCCIEKEKLLDYWLRVNLETVKISLCFNSGNCFVLDHCLIGTTWLSMEIDSFHLFVFFGVCTCMYTSCASMGTCCMWMFIDVHVEAQGWWIVLSGSPTLLTERESHRCV